MSSREQFKDRLQELHKARAAWTDSTDPDAVGHLQTLSRGIEAIKETLGSINRDETLPEPDKGFTGFTDPYSGATVQIPLAPKPEKPNTPSKRKAPNKRNKK